MIILYIAQSVDGYIARVNGAIDWLDEFNEGTEPNPDNSYNEFFAGIDTILMGRKSYDQILTFGEWPYVGKKCYVFTSGELQKPPKNADVTRAEGNVKTFVSRACEGKRVWLLGGAGLVKEFSAQNLIDEYVISTIPVIIGSGIRLFSESNANIKLRCTKSKQWTNGIVETTFVPK